MFFASNQILFRRLALRFRRFHIVIIGKRIEFIPQGLAVRILLLLRKGFLWISQIGEDTSDDGISLELGGQHSLYVFHHENGRTMDSDYPQILSIKKMTFVLSEFLWIYLTHP